jgi:uncharacterized protein YjiK
MSLIAYSEFVNRVRQQVWPDSDGAHLEPANLAFPHSTYIQNALIQAQTYIECLRENNVEVYELDDATVNCGVAIFDLPEHARIGAVYAYKLELGCRRYHYTQKSVQKIMCFVDQYSECKCTEENDICNAVRSGDAVCDNLASCDDYDPDVGEDATNWKCEDKIFAVGRGGKLYVAPRIPCGWRLAVHWEGIKYRYADTDLITDDPDLLDLVATYVQAERARTFDRDLPLYLELVGKGPSRRGAPGSAWHEKLAAAAHRCREERRIRKRECLEMWDDSAMSSENIGAQLNPVPDRDDEGVEFERCDGCPEGQVLIDGACIDCLTPIVSISASDTTLVTGQAVTITWSSSNVIDLETSHVTLEHGGESIEVTPNEGGSLTFTPTADTTYTIRANTVCGEDVTASVSVTVDSEIDGCPCPTNIPDCLSIIGFDDYTFLDQPLVTAMVQESFNAAISGPASDLSGLTYSPVTGTVFGIKNVNAGDSEIYEWDKDGTLLRTITTTNFTDTEGICWMYGTTFAICEENPNNRITIVTINDATTSLNRTTYAAASFSSGISAGNLGIEGVAYDPARDVLYFTTEKPVSGNWHIYTMNPVTGSVAALCSILATVGAVATDVADIYYDPNSEHIFLLSDESNSVIEITRAGVVVRQLAITGFTQPEGLAFNPNMTLMWVSGEPAEWAKYAAPETVCAEGNTSTAPAWDGTLEQVTEGECVWGFALGTKSYRDENISAFVLLDHCEDGIPVYRLQVLLNATDGAEMLWTGTSTNLAIGTYERDASLTCGPERLELQGCDCDAAGPTVEFDPPAGASVAFPTIVFITASDESAIIHYTVDGSEPTNNSPIYTGPISLAEGDTLRARAYTTNCIGAPAQAAYTAVDGFVFDYICDSPDRAGAWSDFGANGEVDYHWSLLRTTLEEENVKRLEIYETNSQGVWVTGQAWATINPCYPAEMDGSAFNVYPLVVDSAESGTYTQINSAYGEPLTTLTADGTHNLQMYGQPAVELVGYFKLLYVLDDGAGGERIIYKLIPHDCYYSDDYYTDDFEEEPNDQSPNIFNVAIQRNFNTLKSGAAAVGAAGDYWNTLNFMLAGDAELGDAPTRKWANGTDSAIGIAETSDVPGFGSTGGIRSIFDSEIATIHADQMMKKGGRTYSDNYTKQIGFVNLGRGLYDIYVYGHGGETNQTLNCRAVAAITERPFEQTAEGTGWNGAWVEGENYVKFENFQFNSIEEATLYIQFAPGEYSYVQGIQIVRKS